MTFALLLLPSFASAQLDVSAVSAKVGGSVVTIRAFAAGGRRLGLGSGFALEDGRVVTNAHVVRGAATVEIFSASGDLLGTASFAEALSNTVDIAILPRIAGLVGLQLADSLPAVGSAIVVVGAPGGLSNTVSNGIVSGLRELDGRRFVQITAPISPGSSGGPVVDLEGRVIGVSVASLRDGQNLNFAVPASNIRILAQGVPTQIAFGSVGATSQRAFQGDSPLLEVTFGETMTESLDASDPVLDDDSSFDDWTFEAVRGDIVEIRMSSADFDTYLAVGRMTGSRFIKMQEDDDGGSGTNSRIRFRVPADGQYIIRANSLYGGALGTYDLVVTKRR